MGSPDQITSALKAWATAKFGGDADIVGAKRLSGGASQETWAFDVVSGGAATPCILRRAPGGTPVPATSHAIGLPMEAKLISAAAEAGVPVPAVLGVMGSDSAIGDAYIMSRIAGETLGRKILRDEEFAAARPRLSAQCGKALAGIHSIPLGSLPDLPANDGVSQLDRYDEIYRSFDLPRPVFELALAWLRDTAPEPAQQVLVHGDFRLGNLMVDAEGLASVLDWELAHIGDPREDIAWLCVNSWRFGHSENRVGGFGPLDELLDAYAAAGGQRFREQDIDWWEIMGSLKWGIMCMIMYRAYSSGADPSVERAAIGRRVSETEIDLVNLLEGVRARA
ncbi:MAG: phosphotransferase family protein [Hyphomonas sp.]|nr:phosphotransferase family protein [Hyphomonas sp.]